MKFETYSRFWAVYVLNGGEATGFYTNVWRDTASGAERFVRGMYPHATIVHASPA